MGSMHGQGCNQREDAMDRDITSGKVAWYGCSQWEACMGRAHVVQKLPDLSSQTLTMTVTSMASLF